MKTTGGTQGEATVSQNYPNHYFLKQVNADYVSTDQGMSERKTLATQKWKPKQVTVCTLWLFIRNKTTEKIKLGRTISTDINDNGR